MTAALLTGKQWKAQTNRSQQLLLLLFKPAPVNGRRSLVQTDNICGLIYNNNSNNKSNNASKQEQQQ
jgi:hypothetical protein